MHIPREENEKANELAQHAFSFKEVQSRMDLQMLPFSKIIVIDQQSAGDD